MAVASKVTEEDRIALGLYCEELLQQDYFNVVAQQFKAQCFEHFVAATDATEREAVYHQMRGAQDFLAHMAAYVNDKDQILKVALSQDDQDAHIEGID